MLKYSERVESWRRRLAFSVISSRCFSAFCNSQFKFFKIQRLFNEIKSAGFGRFYGFGCRAVRGYNDHFRVRSRVLDVTHHFQAIHVRQLQIADRQMMSTLIEKFYRFAASERRCQPCNLLPEDSVLKSRLSLVVIDHQNSYIRFATIVLPQEPP